MPERVAASTARPALLLAVALVLVLTGCGGPVEVDVPELSGAERKACEAFAADLPDTLYDRPRVEIEPSGAPAAAYGDPAIVVRCGVGEPEGWDLATSCEIVNDVGYYIPEEQYDDQGLDLTVTTAGYRPRIEVRLPAEYRPNGGPAAMAVLAPLVEEHLRLVDSCE